MRAISLITFCSVMAVGVGTALAAQPGQTQISLTIEPQTLNAALQVFAQQTGIQVLYRDEDVHLEGIGVARLAGRFSAQEALDRLFASGDFSYEWINERTIRVVSKVTTAASSSAYLASVLWQKAESAQGGRAESRRDSSSNDNSREGGMEEVLVTAQRREQSLQDVPLSVTALGEESLQKTGADSFADYLSQSAGAHYLDAGNGRSRINMRGMSTTQSGSFTESQNESAVYIDDFPSLTVANPWAMTDLRVYDVERVEVLRGPQGTLFGSGSLSGAVRIITRKPDTRVLGASLEAVGETTAGGQASERYNAMVNIPLVDDKLALRTVGYYRSEGGYVDNTFRNEKNTNGGESWGGRIMVGYTPLPALTLRYTLTHQDDSFDDVNRVNLDQTPDYGYDGWNAAYTKVRLTLHNLVGEYDAGPVLLTSSTTYADSFTDLGQGLGQLMQSIFNWRTGPQDTFEEHNAFTARTVAEEVRVTSQTAGRWKWLAGGFYMDQDLGQNPHWFASTHPDLLTLSAPAHAVEKALFGEASFDLTNTVTLTAGARLFDYNFSKETTVATGEFGAILGYTPLPRREVSEDGVTPKFALTYKPVDSATFYVEAAKGFRIGEPNPTAGAVDTVSGEVVPAGYKSDNLWSYEVGVKSLLADRTLRMNLALFYVDWKDIPMLRFTRGVGTSFTDNAGDAVSKGAELEIEWSPNEHFEAGSSVSFVNAKLVSVLPDIPFAPGNRLPGSPRFQSSNYLQLSQKSFAGVGDAFVRLSHRYVGRQVDYLDNSIGAWSDRYNVVDLGAGLSFGRFEAGLHVDNVADNDAVTTRSVNALYLNPSGFAYRLRPRTVGATLRVLF